MTLFFSKRLPRDLEARASTLRAMGYAPLYTAEQVHGDTVLHVDSEYLYAEGDALITDRAGVFIGVKWADCVPILLYDHRRKAIGAAHAGWRGTALRVARKTVEAMTTRFGCVPADMQAFIGPCVCAACYETGPEVPEALGAEASGFVTYAGGKPHVDLRGVNALWLRDAGVGDIFVSQACTCCSSDLYWSHRRHKADRGVQLAVIGL